MNSKNKIPANFWKELQELHELEENLVLEELEFFFDLINDKALKVVDSEKQTNPNNPILLPFSLFQPMNRERDEVNYTKTLAWLMNNDSKILKVIVEMFKFKVNPLKKYHVEAEVWDNEQKNRLDIAVIDGDQIIITIEAKIDSEESKRFIKETKRHIYQLEDYDKWLDKYHPNCKTRIFLATDEDIKISSKKWDIFTWKNVATTLIKFLKKADSTTPDCHYLCFYVASIYQDIYEIDPKNNLAIANLINSMKGQ